MSSSDQQAAKDAADAERELVRLWRAWRTVHEMCQDRVCAILLYIIPGAAAELTSIYQGYELAEEEVRISLDDFRAQYADSTGHPEYAPSNSPAFHASNPKPQKLIFTRCT